MAESALGYASLYRTPAQRAHLAATFGSSGAASALIGPAHEIQTVAGFTAWRSLGVLSVVGAVWGLMTGTRLLRGEEDAGRWELLLAGQTTRRRAAAQAIAGSCAGVAMVWALTALIAALVGRSSRVGVGAGAALFLALALVSSAAVFLVTGAVASQLTATRRQAAAYAGAALGVSYLLRMVADSGIGLAWLRWTTPLGWVEQLEPLTAPHPLALLPITALATALAGLAVVLAGVRDLGTSTLPDRERSQPHMRLLSRPLGLTVRLVRPTALEWAVALAGMALVFGLIAKSAKGAFSSSLKQEFSRLGAPGTGADAYLGVGFLLLAVLVALVAAGQISAARAEEAEGRLDHLLVRPTSRSSWLIGRLFVTIVVLWVGGVVAGVCAWFGAASQHAGVTVTSVVGAGLNIVPPALCVLGIGTLVLGIWPRVTSLITYGFVAWSFLVEFIGGIVGLNHWVLDTSVFHQMASAPAVSPNWTAGGILVAIGAGAALVGGAAFDHRDVRGE